MRFLLMFGGAPVCGLPEKYGNKIYFLIRTENPVKIPAKSFGFSIFCRKYVYSGSAVIAALSAIHAQHSGRMSSSTMNMPW